MDNREESAIGPGPVDLGVMLAAVGLGLMALALFDLGGYWQFIQSLQNW